MKSPYDLMTTKPSFTNQLRGKSRRRRDELDRMAKAAATPRPLRNDLLPLLALSCAVDEASADEQETSAPRPRARSASLASVILSSSAVTTRSLTAKFGFLNPVVSRWRGWKDLAPSPLSVSMSQNFAEALMQFLRANRNLPDAVPEGVNARHFREIAAVANSLSKALTPND